MGVDRGALQCHCVNVLIHWASVPALVVTLGTSDGGVVELPVSVGARLTAASVALGVPALIVAATVVVALRSLRGPAGSLGRTALVARRHAVVVHVVAWLVALLAYPLLAFDVVPGVHDLARRYGTAVGGQAGVGDGVVLGLAPAGVGLAFLLVHVVGELTWPRPTGRVRRATLRPRRVADVAPRGMHRVAWTWYGLLVATLVTCGLTAAPDGRTVALERTDWGVTSGPFPGWFHGVPLLVAASLVVLGQAAVLRLVARRPAVADAAEEWDRGLRRLSAHRVLRGTQLVLGLTAGAVLVVAGMALQSLGAPSGIGPRATASPGHVVGGTALLVVGVAVVVVACALTLRPGPAPQAPGGHDPVDDGGAGGGAEPQPDGGAAPQPDGAQPASREARSVRAGLDRPTS